MLILIIGSQGFVGRSLTRHFRNRGHQVIATFKHSLSIGQEPQIREAIELFKPDVIVNAAGDKNLQRCEDNPTEAFQTNALAPAMLARVCIGKTKLVHIGSDHGYALPETAYGKSKANGDYLVRCANPDALVVVTGHVYSLGCPWVQWLDGELRAGRRVEAWSDIYAYPTYAPNLGDMILGLVKRDVKGRVTCVGPDEVDRWELFRAYAFAVNLDRDLVVPFQSVCPSKLHPRKFMLVDPYQGPVRRVGVAEGFAEMARGVL